MSQWVMPVHICHTDSTIYVCSVYQIIIFFYHLSVYLLSIICYLCISLYIFLSCIQLSPVLLSFIFILSTNLSYIYHLNSHIFPLSFIQFISSLYNLFIFHLSICQLALFLFLFIPNVFYHSTVNLCSVYGVQIHFMRP